MNLTGALEIQDSKLQTIAFTGGGGKSTLMYHLASQLAEKGKRVLVTTTTMIFHPDIKKRIYDVCFTGSAEEFLLQVPPGKGTITVAGAEIMAFGKKIKGFVPDKLNFIQDSGYFDIVLVEADGARGKPIKAPSEYEPVIPLSTDIVLGVIGVDSIGTKINEKNVHRPEIFIKITGSDLNDIINKEMVITLLASKNGIFKGASRKSRKIVIFNKCDTPMLIFKAEEIARDILESSGIEKILITSMTGQNPVISLIKTRGLNNGTF